MKQNGSDEPEVFDSFLLPFYLYNGLYNKWQDIGRKCITFSPISLPFVLQKFICMREFVKYRSMYDGLSYKKVPCMRKSPYL